MNTSQLYQKALLEHHKKPYGFEKEIEANATAHGSNVSCGDEISLKVNVQQENLVELAFTGDSCAICRASASLLCQHMENLPLNEVKKMVSLQLEKLTKITRSSQLFENEFEPLNVVVKFPIRKQCAILPWSTLDNALNELKH
jgi:nitrogen fixation NifU-like protein